MSDPCIRMYKIYRTHRVDGDQKRLAKPALIGRVIAELGWAGGEDRHHIKPPFVRRLPSNIKVKFCTITSEPNDN